MDIFGRVTTRSPDNDSIPNFLPLENGARPDAQLPANFGGY